MAPCADKAGDRRILAGFLVLFSALYGGYGALSPFLPAFLQERGLSAIEISRVLAAAMVVRLVVGPLAGRLADATGATRTILACALGLAAVTTLTFLSGGGFLAVLAIGLAQAVATAPMAPLADALALSAARGGRGFTYGWVRGAGSAAFIAASALTGLIVARSGLSSAPFLCALLFGLASFAAMRVSAPAPAARVPAKTGFRDLLRIARFRRLVLTAALVIGAHAMHDAYAVILWTGAGLSSGAAGLLWAESVAAEIAVFLLIGPRLIVGIGPSRALTVAALAGALRWAVQAQTTWWAALVGIQALHGFTFALLHLACLSLIEAEVPERLRATALTVYGTFGLGLATALLMLASGLLYERFGAHGFLAMSALSLAAVPMALALGRSRAAPKAAI